MSRVTVREAIATYLENADITHLNLVKRHPAKFTAEGEFMADDGDMSGAIVHIYFASQRETREAFGGEVDGRKRIEYSVVLDCLLRSSQPTAEDAGADNETFIDSLVTAIRANRTANSNGVIFQWGEGSNGGSDIDVVTYYPRLLRGAGSVTSTYSSVRVTVVEIVNS